MKSNLNEVILPSETQFHLTFDIDWAPDWSIDWIRRELNARNIKASFFVTHETDLIVDLIRDGHHIGLHPNFLPNSSQGQSPEAVIENLLRFVPDAQAMRSHALYQSSPLLLKVFRKFPQLRYDLSVFMYKFSCVDWFDWTFGPVHFKRLNYNFEDDAAFEDKTFDWARYLPFAMKTVFDFHPIHLALNSNSEASYCRLKDNLGGRPLWMATKNQVATCQNVDLGGTKTYFLSLLDAGARSLSFEELK